MIDHLVMEEGHRQLVQAVPGFRHIAAGQILLHDT